MENHIKIKKREKHQRLSKKGSGVLDIYYIFIFFFTSIFVVALALLVFGKFNDGLQTSDGIPSSVKASSTGFNNLFRNVADGAIVFWFAVLWIGSLASAFFLDNSPIYFVIFFLLSIGSYFILIPFANIQYDLSQTDALSSLYALLPMAMFINNNMIYFISAYIISIGLALYIKFKVVM
jgi:hypothetical protein